MGATVRRGIHVPPGPVAQVLSVGLSLGDGELVGQDEPWGRLDWTWSLGGAGGVPGQLPRAAGAGGAPDMSTSQTRPQEKPCKGYFSGPLDMLLFNNAVIQTGDTSQGSQEAILNVW